MCSCARNLQFTQIVIQYFTTMGDPTVKPPSAAYNQPAPKQRPTAIQRVGQLKAVIGNLSLILIAEIGNS